MKKLWFLVGGWLLKWGPACLTAAIIIILLHSGKLHAQPCGDAVTFTDPRDGKVYHTVRIGDQCWMSENLAWLPEVFHPSQVSASEARYYVYWYFDGDVAEAKNDENYLGYGVLYNWPAARDACPTGWHLPGDSEWQELTRQLGGTAHAGGKLKSRRVTPDPHPRWVYPNEGATDAFGFSALPAGACYNDGQFGNRGSQASFWSSTPYVEGHAWSQNLYGDGKLMFRHHFPWQDGFSVRCIRD